MRRSPHEPLLADFFFDTYAYQKDAEEIAGTKILISK